MRVIECVIFLLWLFLVLRKFQLGGPVLAAANDVLGGTLVFGSFRLTLGQIVACALVIWFSFIVSRFLRFLLEEDVYDRLKLSRGLPYAISAVLHYTILLLGFFFALAALGVDMTKFTILAGAFIQLTGYVLLRRLSKDLHKRTFNRLLGVIPGLANGLITAALVSAMLLVIPMGEALRERARESPLVNRLAIYAEEFEAALHPVFAEAVAETLNFLTVQPESNERVALPYKVASPRPRPDLEARMLELVNQE